MYKTQKGFRTWVYRRTVAAMRKKIVGPLHNNTPPPQPLPKKRHPGTGGLAQGLGGWLC